MINITKQKFLTYENVRQSGVTNMFDVITVMKFSRLTKEECLDIMKNYSKYSEQYLKKEEEVIVDEIKKEEIPVEEKKQEIIPEIKYKDDNGCSYFGWCKKTNKDGLVNCTCFNPMYFIDKIDRKCTQLTERKDTPKEKKQEVEEEKTTLRTQIKDSIIKDQKKTFTVVDIIKQEVARGNKDVGLIFQSLKTIFTEEKDSDLRKRIKPTIAYLEKKAGK